MARVATDVVGYGVRWWLGISMWIALFSSSEKIASRVSYISSHEILDVHKRPALVPMIVVVLWLNAIHKNIISSRDDLSYYKS
jgi:hypothetical protein